MKKFLFILSTFFNAAILQSSAQVTNMFVETYYISNDSDATDIAGSNYDSTIYLKSGSKTYRVYIELAAGSKLVKIYGDAGHPLEIESTFPFFNNLDRGENFGKDINQNRIDENTVALDSWITLGLATKIHAGVLKTEDTDGSIVGGSHNDGGSKPVSQGLLSNNDPTAGIPLTTSDGLMPDTTTYSQWVASGDLYGSAPDTTIFGTDTSKTAFISTDCFLQQNSGVIGVIPSGNKVLVAQLTTLGELSLHLNVEVEEPNGASTQIVKYVAQLAAGEVNSDTLKVSPWLSYPTACGCRDPHYIEYSSQYACDDPDSCQHPVVYGCMDTMACNYNPNANFNITSLCCYPGYCNDRDIALVCPELNSERIRLYPNPVHNILNMEITSQSNREWRYEIVNSFGRVVVEEKGNVATGKFNLSVNTSKLNSGLYLFRYYSGEVNYNNVFMKN